MVVVLYETQILIKFLVPSLITVHQFNCYWTAVG
jgi:hypothetical protein